MFPDVPYMLEHTSIYCLPHLQFIERSSQFPLDDQYLQLRGWILLDSQHQYGCNLQHFSLRGCAL